MVDTIMKTNQMNKFGLVILLFLVNMQTSFGQQVDISLIYKSNSPTTMSPTTATLISTSSLTTNKTTKIDGLYLSIVHTSGLEIVSKILYNVRTNYTNYVLYDHHVIVLC